MSEDTHWPEDMAYPPTHEEILDSIAPGDVIHFPSSGYQLTVERVDKGKGEIALVDIGGMKRIMTESDNCV